MDIKTEQSLVINLRKIAEDLNKICTSLDLLLKPAVVFKVDNSPESKSILKKMSREVCPGAIIRLNEKEMDYLERNPIQQFYPKFERMIDQ